MLELTDVAILLVFISCAAWLWRGHGIRERALALVRRHCEKAEVILLDDNVALQRLQLLPDGRGRRRLARVYGFEFTVTGEQRHIGSVSMFGQQLGKIELAAHPFVAKPDNDAPVAELFGTQTASATPTDKPFPRATAAAPTAEVILLSDWRQRHSGSDKLH